MAVAGRSLESGGSSGSSSGSSKRDCMFHSESKLTTLHRGVKKYDIVTF